MTRCPCSTRHRCRPHRRRGSWRASASPTTAVVPRFPGETRTRRTRRPGHPRHGPGPKEVPKPPARRTNPFAIIAASFAALAIGLTAGIAIGTNIWDDDEPVAAASTNDDGDEQPAAQESRTQTPKPRFTTTPTPTPTGPETFQLGDGGTYSEDGKPVGSITVEAATTTADAPDEYSDPPANGIFLTVTVVATALDGQLYEAVRHQPVGLLRPRRRRQPVGPLRRQPVLPRRHAQRHHPQRRRDLARNCHVRRPAGGDPAGVCANQPGDRRLGARHDLTSISEPTPRPTTSPGRSSTAGPRVRDAGRRERRGLAATCSTR